MLGEAISPAALFVTVDGVAAELDVFRGAANKHVTNYAFTWGASP